MMWLWGATIGFGLAGGLVGWVVADVVIRWRDGETRLEQDG